ncbi:MAG: hypothetical protein JWP04_2632, partial [Belnapia sp.]|nr:hypothetical protein [Belnapia sp.]
APGPRHARVLRAARFGRHCDPVGWMMRVRHAPAASLARWRPVHGATAALDAAGRLILGDTPAYDWPLLGGADPGFCEAPVGSRWRRPGTLRQTDAITAAKLATIEDIWRLEVSGGGAWVAGIVA